MTQTLLALIAGLAGLGFLAWLRWQDMQAWARSLVRYQLSLPRDLTASEVASWLGQLSAITVPGRWSLIPPVPVGLEIEATSHGITHFVLVPGDHEAAVLASLRAALPRVRVEMAEKVSEVPAFQAAAELRLTNRWTPLAEDRVESAATAQLAALQPLPSGAMVRVQWLVAGARATTGSAGIADVLGWLTGSPRDDRDNERETSKKQRHPLLIATGRVAVYEPTTGHAYGVMHRITAACRVLNAPGVEVRRRHLPTRLVRRRITGPTMPFAHWPVFVNAVEAVGLVGLPLNGPALPGLRLGVARQVPLSPASPRTGVIIGESTYPGTPRPLALKPDDRLRHLYCLGPTGVGKSTLVASLALQDIAAGSGVVVVDPKGDLIDVILSRFPDERRDDIVLLDPASMCPVGLNPLRARGDELQRELAAETTVHILHDIFRAHWGPRTDDLLRAAMQSLVQVPAPNGQPFTMCEVPELLTNPALRQYVTNHGRLDERWREYWQGYDSLSEGERLAAIGAPLNKLRAFSTRTSLRLVLGQSQGFDLTEVFTRRKVLLVPLAKGQIGKEAATLLGSLLVGALWQATLARSAVPAERRRPVFAYLDEFQDIVRLTDDIADMLAQARGLGLSLMLAHQYAKQIPEKTRAAVLGTARSQIFFQMEYDDAMLLDRRVAPTLSAADLMGLATHEIAARLCVDGQTLAPVTGRTLPLSEPVREAGTIREELAASHGMARADVEAGLRSRTRPKTSQRPIRLGEVPARGGQS